MHRSRHEQLDPGVPHPSRRLQPPHRTPPSNACCRAVKRVVRQTPALPNLPPIHRIGDGKYDDDDVAARKYARLIPQLIRYGWPCSNASGWGGLRPEDGPAGG